MVAGEDDRRDSDVLEELLYVDGRCTAAVNLATRE